MITTQRINASASHNDVADQTNYSTAEETTLQDLNTEKINIFDIVYTPDSINEQ